jgi:hypothetical protein
MSLWPYWTAGCIHGPPTSFFSHFLFWGSKREAIVWVRTHSRVVIDIGKACSVVAISSEKPILQGYEYERSHVENKRKLQSF